MPAKQNENTKQTNNNNNKTLIILSDRKKLFGLGFCRQNQAGDAKTASLKNLIKNQPHFILFRSW